MSETPSSSSTQARIGFVKGYLFSIPGVLRICLIASLFASWVSAAAVLRPSFGTNDIPSSFASARGAILFFSIVGDLLCIAIFAVHVANIVSLKRLSKIPWTLLVTISDVVGMIPTLILAIVAAIKENDQKNLNIPGVSKGAFGSAAFFGFLSSLILAGDAIYHVVILCKQGIKAPPTTIN